MRSPRSVERPGAPATLRDVLNLALHQADVITDLASLTVIENVGVIARRGEAIAVHGTDVVERLVFSSIEVVERDRVYRLTGPDGVWLIRRTGGCRTCLSTSTWPIRQ